MERTGGVTSGDEKYWEEKDTILPPAFIFPNATIERKITPLANRTWHKGWAWSYLKPGMNGVLLTIMVDGKEITEKMVFEFIITK